MAMFSFLIPLLLWSAVSYLPFVWHPLVKISQPGDVDYFSADMLIEKEIFLEENKAMRETGKREAEGVPANPVYLPAPHEVARALYGAFTTPPQREGDPWMHQSLWHSIKVIFWGFIISSIIGIPLGIMAGSSKTVSRLSEPFIDFMRYMPAPAFGALAVAILGIHDGPKIAIIVLGTFFQQVLVVANSTRKLDPALREAAQTLGAGRRQLLFNVTVPGILPDIYKDTRILLGWAWTYLIVAEVVGTSSGITWFINQQAKYRIYENVYAAIIIIGMIGLITDRGLAWLGDNIFAWQNSRSSKWVSRMRGKLDSYTRSQNLKRQTVIVSDPLPQYTRQSDEVKKRFAEINQRPAVVRIDNISKTFRDNRGMPRPVLKSISLEAHRREFICVIGPSGCGKSTLARLLAGLEHSEQGKIFLEEKEIKGPGPERGMVFQGYTLFPWLTVEGNVMFGLRMSGLSSSVASARAEEWIEMVGLSAHAHSYPHQLSGGMKQRVAIARALAAKPRVLLMDEPFGALDAQTRSKMQKHLLEIWKNINITIIFITHDLDEAVYLADKIVVLKADPGEIQEVIEVPVTRPRNPAQMASPEFLATRKRLEELIHQGAGRTEKEELAEMNLPRMTLVGDEAE